MNILQELTALITSLGYQVETGVFGGEPPDVYVVITPLSDTFPIEADDRPLFDLQEARLSLFSVGNWVRMKDEIVRKLINADFTVTARQYIEHDDEDDYHHYAVDTAKLYEWS